MLVADVSARKGARVAVLPRHCAADDQSIRLPFSFSSTMFLFTAGARKSPQSWQAEVWGGNLYVSVLIAFS
jgi:hypothetical protein